MTFEQLDYVYTPTRDAAADVRFFTDVLGGALVFAIDEMGTRVAMVSLTEEPPGSSSRSTSMANGRSSSTGSRASRTPWPRSRAAAGSAKAHSRSPPGRAARSARQAAIGSRSTSGRARSSRHPSPAAATSRGADRSQGAIGPAGDDRERQRDPAALLLAHVGVAAPPVDRVLRDALQPQPGAQERGDDLAERPRPGELPALVGLVDREAVDVLGRPPLRRLGAAEVVVVGGDPVAVLVDVEQPFGRVALEQHEPAGRGEQPARRRRPSASRSWSQISEPRPVYTRSAVPSNSWGVISTSDRTQRAGAPVASVRRAASSSMRGLKSMPTTSSAPRFQSESVSRPPAHCRWIALVQWPCRSPIRACSASNRFEPPPRISAIASASQPS